MATRTSHSSPCFLRVAAASAASSASKMISLSTPFSLETASTTIRISLFIVRTPLYAWSDSRRRLYARDQSCPVNVLDRQAHFAAVRFERDLALPYLFQAPLEALA